LETRLIFINLTFSLFYSSLSYGKNEEYVGSFKENMRHGHGTFKLTNGKNSLDTVYVGDWLNDVKSGYGVLDFIIRYVYKQVTNELLDCIIRIEYYK